MPVLGVGELGADDAAFGQPGLHGGGVVLGDAESCIDQIQAGGDLDHDAAREMAFQFGPAELGGFEVELGAEDVAGSAAPS